MILIKEEISRWTNTSDSKRNFKEGEWIINAGHIIYCGKNIDFNGSVRYSAKCLSISSLKREPHEIKREVLSSRRILLVWHALGILLYCYRLVSILHIFLHLISYYVSDLLIRNFGLIHRFGVDKLDKLSSTDKPCSWKRDCSKSLEQYKPVSLKENESFKFKINKIVKALNVGSTVSYLMWPFFQSLKL